MRFLYTGLLSTIGISHFTADAQLNFASLGAWGRNNHDQRAVAQSLKSCTHKTPISFIVSPGANFMEGVSDLEDSAWDTHFKDIYEGPELNVPFFAALGTNDWDGNVTAMMLKTNATYGRPLSTGLSEPDMHEASPEVVNNLDEHYPELPRAYKGPRWTLPNFYYHYTQSFADTTSSSHFLSSPEVSVFFVFIDTKVLGENFPVDPVTTRHWNDLRTTLEGASKTYDWVIVVGDQSILSSGSKGGSSYLKENLRPLLKDNYVDAYISGSDHDMEIIEDGSLTHITCGSGGGGTAGGFKSESGSVYFSSKAGFCLHSISQKVLTTQLISGYGENILHTYGQTRNSKPGYLRDRLYHLNRIPSVSYLPLPPGVGGSIGSALAAAVGQGRHPNSIFVTICGALGLMSAMFIGSAGMATTAKRFQKYRKRR